MTALATRSPDPATASRSPAESPGRTALGGIRAAYAGCICTRSRPVLADRRHIGESMVRPSIARALALQMCPRRETQTRTSLKSVSAGGLERERVSDLSPQGDSNENEFKRGGRSPSDQVGAAWWSGKAAGSVHIRSVRGSSDVVAILMMTPPSSAIPTQR